MTVARTRPTISTLPSYSYDGDLKRAIDIADYYGFRLMDSLPIEKDDRECAEKLNCPYEHAAIMRLINEDERYRNGTDALLLAHTRKVPYKNKLELRLEVIGDRESTAEALLFQATNAILREHGFEETLVAVNSVGGRETTVTYTQAVSAFLRARIADLDPECRDRIRKSVFSPLRCSHPACVDARADAPQSLNYLSEPSKIHFKEVLEYLESLQMPYVIDPSLVGSEHYTTRTVYSIGIPDATAEAAPGRHFSRMLAWGERYDQLAKKMGGKKPIPAAHMTIDLDTRSVKERYEPVASCANPQIYVVQVGFPAKVRALLMNEDLRKARIRVSVNLHKKSVTEQMDQARVLGAPFLVIIGQKEVRDGAALIRHLPTNHQETVPFSRLPSYLKAIYATRKRA